MGHTLESHKLFPIIAWTLVIGFATFTYTLTMHLSAALADIEAKIDTLSYEVSKNPSPKNVEE